MASTTLVQLTMFDFLGVYSRDKLFLKQTAFQSILLMGYAVAGLDLDSFTYHLLLNSLVEEGDSFDAVDVIAEQISARGFERDVTHTIVVKSLCRQNMLADAEAYLREMLLLDDGHAVSVLVDALFRVGRFDKAGRKLLEEFKELGVRPMEPAYGVWLKDLVQAGKVDGALEFLQSKKSLEGYVPEILRYNYLLNRLLKENRLGDAYDLLTETRESGITPDRCTMNAALCFFCKAGMVGVALELYNSRSDLSFSPNTMAFNYLINSLCGDGSVDEAYHVLKNWTQQHASAPPGRQTFYTLADTLSGEDEQVLKLLEMQLSVHEHNCHIYDIFIDGAGSGKRPDLAKKVFEMMHRNGIEPNLECDTLLLRSYLRDHRVADAVAFLNQRRKLCVPAIVSRFNAPEVPEDFDPRHKFAGPLKAEDKTALPPPPGDSNQKVLIDGVATLSDLPEVVKPFKEDPGKQDRFQQFLKQKYQGRLRSADSGGSSYMSEAVRAQERLDFELAADALEKANRGHENKFSAQMSMDIFTNAGMQFTSAGFEQVNNTRDKELAMKGMYPKREEYQWRPAPVLCKRFDLVDPYMGKVRLFCLGFLHRVCVLTRGILLLVTYSYHHLHEREARSIPWYSNQRSLQFPWSKTNPAKNQSRSSSDEAMRDGSAEEEPEVEVEVENVERPVDLYKAIFSDDLDEEAEASKPSRVEDPAKKTEVANTTLNRLMAGNFLESLAKNWVWKFLVTYLTLTSN
ncbi:Pentatricopeptide repeat-containing protein At1g71210, mitochondrial [Linum grandiflorum]